MSSAGDRVRVQIVLVVLSLLGVALVFLCTSRYGVGLSPDSSSYISAARSLLSGAGYRYSDGGIYTHWPPLFPTLLAVLGFAGMEPPEAARLLNALAFGAIIFVSGNLFLRSLTSRAFAMLGTLSVVLSAPLLAACGMVWSEPVFIAMTVLFLLCMGSFLHTKRWTGLLAVSLLAGFACLQRYAGVTLILAGGLLIALCVRKASILERLKYLVGFGAMSSAPLAAWILRNRVVAGETAGAHHFHLGSGGELARSAMAAADVVATWLFPDLPYVAVEAMGLGLILLAGGAAIVLARGRCPDRDDLQSRQVVSVVVFGLVYCGFLVLSGAGLVWNPNERVMLPAYVFVMLLVFAGMEAASSLAGRVWTGRKWGELVGLALCAVWLVYPLGQTVDCVAVRVRDGAGDYTSRLWQESPLIHWLRAHPLQGTIYSNVPDAIYLLTGVAARETPHYYWDTTQCASNMSSSQANYIVWSDHLRRHFLYDLRELISRWRMTQVAVFPDGAVYRFLGDGDGGPSLCGVHRFWRPQEGRHVYTLDRREREVLALHQALHWRDEGVVFYVYSEAQHPPDASPVHRFWSDTLRTRFYTVDEAEKDTLTREYSHVWRYEGVAWHAYAQGRQPAEALPVYRFWSDSLQTHFYTIDETERDRLAQEYSHVWRCEGVAWYAYGK